MGARGMRLTDLDQVLCQARMAKEGDYAVVLVQMEERQENSQTELLHFIKNCMHCHRLVGSHPIPYRNGCLLILAKDSLCRIPLVLLQEWQQDFESRFGVRVGIAYGEAYPHELLWKSFREARIAGAFHRISGDWSFVQNYKALGIFANLFAAGEQQVKDFCHCALETLEAYDREYGTELLDTLRVLFRYDFNWKKSATAMFVHVNTLRYRYDKIGQVLEQDLGRMEVRTNLFVAIHARDVLDYLEA